MAHRILNIVAKNEQEQHVAGNMPDTAMHEHRSDQGQPDRNGCNAQARQEHPLMRIRIDEDFCFGDNVVPGQDLAGNGGVSISKMLVVSPFLVIYKYEDIYCYEEIVDDGCRLSVPVVVADRKNHFAKLFCTFKQMTVRIYYSRISKEKHRRILDEFLPEQPPAFREKILRYRKWEDAQLSLLGRVLLNTGLREWGVAGHVGELAFTPFNKPFLPDSTIRFNISHSGTIAVCALADENEIGIDIELIYPIEAGDFRSQMTTGEWQRINDSSDKLSAFYKYWTQKEALIKAHGNGLSLPLPSFEVIDGHAIIDGEHFYLKAISIDKDYECYIASTVDLHDAAIEVIFKPYSSDAG